MAIIRGSPDFVSLKVIYKIIEQMKKCICKIIIANCTGTGFFCYIPYNNKKFPVMITCNHIISDNIIKENEFISIELNNETKNINLKDNRIIYTNKKYNITIIEIIPEKDLIYSFLELDEQIFDKDNKNELFIKESIYTLQCDNKVSFGIVSIIEEYNIFHYCNTDSGSGGSPILNLSNSKVIGIHRGYNENPKLNFGTLLNYPINEFINNNKEYINSKSLSSFIYPIENNINNIENKTENNNDLTKIINELKNELKLEKEKNKKLEEYDDNIDNHLDNDLENLSGFILSEKSGLIDRPKNNMIKSNNFINDQID